MERKSEPGKGKKAEQSHQPPHISPMQPVTRGAYGGGMYGTEEQGQTKRPEKPPASETQSADGPDEARYKPVNKPPPSSGDRDIDITVCSCGYNEICCSFLYQESGNSMLLCFLALITF
ncbi:PREDICTED: uncharacterized protein LOC18591680 [Theobroma cacao]|uniref:Uncharacterized protein LOC18591680 n=1 Tax=Theobroma cacao TaxID=3641 RepID=A0AB32WTR0_THECC|nr:PREDICTED: uncharacterized protein LOC18591680 [Theobroma cacao]